MRVIRDELRDAEGNVLAIYAGILAATPEPGEGPGREPMPYDSPARVTLAEPNLDRIRELARW